MFPALDRLVGFLGAYSEEANLDDLLPTLTLERARRKAGGHALLMRCAAGDGYLVDRLARLSAATGGRLYTGGGAVFVRWRGREAPFGYDLAEPVLAGGNEVIAVDEDYLTEFEGIDMLDPVELIQRLSLRPVPLPLGGPSQDPEFCGLRELALALVAPGLVERTMGYLWRLEANMAGYFVHLDGDRQASLLLRLRHPSGRVLDVLHGTPGIELLAPVSSRAAVEVGYRHPIHLASASTCFPGEEMFLFRGSPRFIDGRHLVESRSGESLRDVGPLEPASFEPMQVDLRVRPSVHPREPRGALVRWDQADLLRHLIYLIPPSALAASRVAPLEEGIVVLTGSSVGARSPVAAAGLGARPSQRRSCL